MSQVRVTAVTKNFGPVAALDGVTLGVERGELLAVLGPSGCGKTTLLRCLAGLERIDSGTITIADRVVAGPGVHVAAHQRGAAIVPQDASLFPHLDVAHNVGFGLGRRPDPARIDEVLELVGLAGYGRRMPHELSGGQQQRVSVARALAPRPPLILLDEPFSALDAALRSELRDEVRAALHGAGATALLVTHDQGEALSMADRVAVMRGGVLRQIGTPASVYNAPHDAWVAGFVGEANLWPAVALRDGDFDTPIGVVPGLGEGDTLLMRPEKVVLQAAPPPGVPRAGGVRGTVERIDYHGHDALVTVRTATGVVQARVTGATPAVGASVLAVPKGPGRLLRGA